METGQKSGPESSYQYYFDQKRKEQFYPIGRRKERA
jgi:hypothetical protein